MRKKAKVETAPEVVLPALIMAGINIKALEARVGMFVGKFKETGIVPLSSIANEVRDQFRPEISEALYRLAAAELASRADVVVHSPEPWSRGVGVRN